jgi:hypothetical protein
MIILRFASVLTTSAAGKGPELSSVRSAAWGH